MIVAIQNFFFILWEIIKTVGMYLILFFKAIFTDIKFAIPSAGIVFILVLILIRLLMKKMKGK